ncbi:hypothetical protein [Hyphobacterium sp.]|uniref:hypothetical protein n=1 Tax=Hyphobacterium sp. TaxID=2004662 RepID=UPI003747958A
MIELLLAGALLLSDAEDCVVLEAVSSANWDEERYMQPILSGPDERFVAVRPPRSWLDAPCLHDEFQSGEAFEACLFETMRQYDGMSPSQRLENSRPERFTFNFRDQEMNEIPGLLSDFVQASSRQQSWDCLLRNARYIQADFWHGVEGNAHTTSENIALLEMSRPGFSDDGQWAVAEFRIRHTNTLLQYTNGWSQDNTDIVIRGHVLLGRDDTNTWQIAERNITLMHY